MPEFLPQNNLKLHQVAKKLLRQVAGKQEALLGDKLYGLQLVAWLLRNDQLPLDPAYEPDLSDQVYALLNWNQKKAHEFLVKPFRENDHEYQDQLQASDLEGLSPLQAAQRILMIVHEKLLALEPVYGPQKR